MLGSDFLGEVFLGEPGPSGGQQVAIGQAVETDSAGAITPTHSLAQAVERDSANSITSVHTVSVGQAAETDSAQTVTPSRSALLARAVEIDSASALAVPFGRAREVDSAQTITPLVPPANNDIADAQVISGFIGSASGDNTGATLEANEAACLGYESTGALGFGGGRTVWFKWTAPGDGRLNVRVDAAGGSPIVDSLLTVIDSDDFIVANVLAQDDDDAVSSYSYLAFPVTSGQTYWIAVDGYNGTATDDGGYDVNNTFDGTFSLVWFGSAVVANDDLADREDLGTPGVVDASGTTAVATAEEWESGDGYDQPSVWYEFTAASTLTGIRSISADYPVYGEVYRITSDPPADFTDLSYVDSFGDGTTTPDGIFFTTVAGAKYVIYVGNWDFDYTYGDFEFTVYDVAGNNPIANAITLSGASDSVYGSNVGFSLVANEAEALGYDTANTAGGLGYGGGKTAWYRYTAADDGVLTISVAAQSTPGGILGDSILTVIDDDDFTTASVVGFDDDSGPGSQAQLTIEVLSGQTYWIAVDGYNGTATDAGGYSNTNTDDGGFLLTATFTSVPLNDTYPENLFPGFESQPYFLNYFSFRSGGCKTSKTTGATAQAGEPDPAPGMSPTHSVWLSWETTFEGEVTAWLEGTEDNVMSVYEWLGDPVGSLGAPLDQGDNELGNQPQVTFNVDPGGVTGARRVVFQIDTRGAGSSFTFHWKRSDGTPPANDDFANAEVLVGIGGETTGTFTTATAECGEPAHFGLTSGGSGPYNTIWWAWTPGVEGTGMVYLTNWHGDTVSATIEVFTGTALTNLVSQPTTQWLPANDIRGIAFAIEPGVTYYIRADTGEDLDLTEDFILVWETNTLDWHARVGSFDAGDTHVVTGLPGAPTAVMIWASGADPGSTLDEMIVGWGGSDTVTQFAAGYSHPFVHSGEAVNGQQFQENLFSSGKIIYVPDAGGGVFADAQLAGVGVGTFDLDWNVTPGSGTFAYLVISGIEAAAGIETFDRSEGADNDVEVVPGIRSRVMLMCVAADSPLPNSGGVPAKNFGVMSLAEDNTDPGLHLGGPGQSDGLLGIETGISWFGGADDEGDFKVASDLGINFAVTDITDQRPWQGTLSYTVRENAQDADWSGSYGWLALGGYGWHAMKQTSPGAFDTDPDTLAQGLDFWIECGLAGGGNSGDTIIEGEQGLFSGMTFGAFDANDDDQFSIGIFANEHQTGFAGTTVQTPVGSSAFIDRILHAVDTTDTPTYNLPAGWWVTDCPGDQATFNGTTDRQGPSPYPVGFPVLLGNFIAQVAQTTFTLVAMNWRSSDRAGIGRRVLPGR